VTAWRTNAPSGEERVVELLVLHDVLLPEIDSAIPAMRDHRIAISVNVLQVFVHKVAEFKIRVEPEHRLSKT
jgi:hypothetical protein